MIGTGKKRACATVLPGLNIPIQKVDNYITVQSWDGQRHSMKAITYARAAAADAIQNPTDDTPATP